LLAGFYVPHLGLIKGTQVAGGAVLDFHDLAQFTVVTDETAGSDVSGFCHNWSQR
jgi:hypothetical protein